MADAEVYSRGGDVLRAALESIGDAVIVTDSGGLVSFLNPVAEALTGGQPRTLSGNR